MAYFKGQKRRLSFMEKYMTGLRPVDCPVCGSGKSTVLGARSRGGLSINSVLCANCSLVYLNPKPLPEKYHEFYASGDYRRFLNIVKGAKTGDDINNFFTEKKFIDRKEYGAQIARKYFSNILVKDDLYFDFGCDSGGIMAGVRDETGCRIMGNEPSRLCADFIRERLGVRILCCGMEGMCDSDKEIYKGKAKAASLIGVLEHVNDPIACLNIAYGVLSDGGFLYVESLDILKRMERNKESVEDAATIDHQYYFHEDVYKYMLRSCNFEVKRFDYDEKGKIMRVLAQKVGPESPKNRFEAAEIVDRISRLNSEAARYQAGIFRRAGKKAAQAARKVLKWKSPS